MRDAIEKGGEEGEGKEAGGKRKIEGEGRGREKQGEGWTRGVKKGARKRKDRESKSEIGRNPAMRFVLERRGRGKTENKEIKIKTKLNVELFYRFEEGSFNPRRKMEELVDRMIMEDARMTVHIKDDEEAINVRKMGEKEFRDGFVVTHYPKRRSVVMKVTVRTAKTVNNLKHDNGGRLG